MKMKNLLAIFMVIFLVGCATQVEEPENKEMETPEPTTEVIEEAPPEEASNENEEINVGVEIKPEEPAAEADVQLTSKGFDPAELTVSAPATVMVKIMSGKKHTISQVGGKFRSAGLTDGQSAELVIEEAGTFTYFDVLSKKKLIITAEATSEEPAAE